MTAQFRLYGAELSPYSVKVRCYLTFKNADFEWLSRSQARQEEFARYAKLPLLPLIVDANERVLQDSTPIIETLERELDGESIVPEDASVAFVAALIEDYADEWLNKAMFHYRWTYPEDQQSAADRIAAMIFADGGAPDDATDNVRSRMTGRLHHVGSSPETAPMIEASFSRAIALFEQLLSKRPYLLGGRPSLADFGAAGQFAQLLSDPTPGAMIRKQAPKLMKWIECMQRPSVEGGFASLAELKGDLTELMQTEIAAAYLPWMSANAEAVALSAQGVSVSIGDVTFVQKPQRYAAKAFTELRRKRLAVNDDTLGAWLGDVGVDAFLSMPSIVSGDPLPDLGDDDAEDDGDAEE